MSASGSSKAFVGSDRRVDIPGILFERANGLSAAATPFEMSGHPETEKRDPKEGTVDVPKGIKEGKEEKDKEAQLERGSEDDGLGKEDTDEEFEEDGGVSDDDGEEDEKDIVQDNKEAKELHDSHPKHPAEKDDKNVVPDAAVDDERSFAPREGWGAAEPGNGDDPSRPTTLLKRPPVV